MRSEHYGDEPDPCPAERHLLTAILERAIRDALRMDLHEAECLANKAAFRQAAEWIGIEDNADGEGPFSFGWVCEHLGYDASRLRADLKGIINGGFKVPKCMCQAKTKRGLVWRYRKRASIAA